MFVKMFLAPAVLGAVLFVMLHTLLQADVLMRQNCLEKATCYKSHLMK